MSLRGAKRRGNLTNRFVRFLVLPLLFYAVFFFIYTYPQSLHFGTHLFTDMHDGLGFAWNIWWVDHAVAVLHQSPWSTNLLYYPQGLSLLPHTLSPLNGFLAIGLLRIFPLNQVYNLLFIFGFLGGGLFMFYLAWDQSRSYWGSLWAGFLFTFSSYHFAHAMGHLNLISIQWIPLFLLFFLRFLKKPGAGNVLLAAVFLLCVSLTDYYYAFYMILIGAALVIREAWLRKDALFLVRKANLTPFAIFVAASLLTTGVLIVSLARVSAKVEIPGHPAVDQSLDLFDPIVHGPLWKFSDITKPYWTKVPKNPLESNVHFGWAFLAALGLIWAGRKKLWPKTLGFWYLIGGIFVMLSFGPNLHVLGKPIFGLMPYRLLEILIPPLRISGVPARMIVVTLLAGALIFALAYTQFIKTRLKKRSFQAVFFLILFVELFPLPMKTNRILIPEHINALRDAPGQGAVLDLVDGAFPIALYYQTVHQKPLAFGFIARVPKRLQEKKEAILAMAGNLGQNISALRKQYGIRYLIAPKDYPGSQGLERLSLDGDVALFDLGEIR